MKKIVLTQDQVVVVDHAAVEPRISGVGCVDVALRYRDVIKPAVFDPLMSWEVD